MSPRPAIITGGATFPTVASISGIVPPTSARIIVVLNANGSSIAQTSVAPNNAYGSSGSTTNPPPVGFNPPTNTGYDMTSEFMLESSNVYYGGGNNQGLFCFGWEDNL